jgi:putative acetyltransferase
MIRKGTPADFSALAEIWRAAWQITYPEIDFSQRLPFIHAQFVAAEAGHHRLSVAVTDGMLAGFTLVEHQTALLEQIVAAPAFWGKGTADALLAQAIAVEGAKLHLIVNQFNARAIAFYRKHGFEIAAEGVNPSGRPTFSMRLQRDQAVNCNAASRA